METLRFCQRFVVTEKASLETAAKNVRETFFNTRALASLKNGVLISISPGHTFGLSERNFETESFNKKSWEADAKSEWDSYGGYLERDYRRYLRAK
jgi:hypothetical protein